MALILAGDCFSLFIAFCGIYLGLEGEMYCAGLFFFFFAAVARALWLGRGVYRALRVFFSVRFFSPSTVYFDFLRSWFFSFFFPFGLYLFFFFMCICTGLSFISVVFSGTNFIPFFASFSFFPQFLGSIFFSPSLSFIRLFFFWEGGGGGWLFILRASSLW